MMPFLKNICFCFCFFFCFFLCFHFDKKWYISVGGTDKDDVFEYVDWSGWTDPAKIVIKHSLEAKGLCKDRYVKYANANPMSIEEVLESAIGELVTNT